MCVNVTHTLFPVASSRAPSGPLGSSRTMLADTGRESRRMFTWGDADLENRTWQRAEGLLCQSNTTDSLRTTHLCSHFNTH